MTEPDYDGPIVDVAGAGVDCGEQHQVVVGLHRPQESVEGWKVPVLVYDRICGYYMPTTNWNPGKLAERTDRVTFDIPGVTDHNKVQVVTD